MADHIPLNELIKLHNLPTNLIPLADDAKTPTIQSTNAIYNNPNYWNEEKLRQDAWRFKNVASTFGKSRVKDPTDGSDLFECECDIDSKEAFTRLAILHKGDKEGDYFFFDEIAKITFLVKTRKKFGYRFRWLSHKQHPPIGTKDCRSGFEFEIKTDNTLGHSTLPPSSHRDDPNFHYSNSGQWNLAISDILYDEIKNILADCIIDNKKEDKEEAVQVGEPVEIIKDGIGLICTIISPYYKKGCRHHIIYSLSGLLRKHNVLKESALTIIKTLAKDDEELESRLDNFETTYKKLPSDVTGKKYFSDIMFNAVLRIDEEHSAKEIGKKAKSIINKVLTVIGVPLTLIAQATEAIRKKHRFLTIEESDAVLYYDKGVYIPGGDILVEKEADAMYGYDLKNRDRVEIKKYIMAKTYHKRQELDSDVNIINIESGLYDIQTNELKPHNPDYLSINQKPIIYDRKARPKLFGKFLSEVCYPDEIRTLVELMAYSFYRDNPIEVLTLLHGFGGNGKGVLFQLLIALHGARNVSSVSLKNMIERPFALYDLVGKDINLDNEVSGGVIYDPAILKKITGRELVRVENKNEKAFDSTLHAKVWLSANKIPETVDDSDGFYRRYYMIAFPNKFEEADLAQGIRKIDPNLIKKLTTLEELSGIFNVIIQALRRVIKDSRIFTNQRTIQKRREKYEMSANPIKAFVKAAFVEESLSSDFTTKESVYQAYKLFCRDYRLPSVTKETFGKRMKGEGYRDGRLMLPNGERPTCWEGINLTKFYLNRVADDSFSRQTTMEEELK